MRNLVKKKKDKKLIGSMTASKKAKVEEKNRIQSNFFYALWNAITTTPADVEKEQQEAQPHKVHIHAGMTRAGIKAAGVIQDGVDPDKKNDGPVLDKNSKGQRY